MNVLVSDSDAIVLWIPPRTIHLLDTTLDTISMLSAEYRSIGVYISPYATSPLSFHIEHGSIQSIHEKLGLTHLYIKDEKEFDLCDLSSLSKSLIKLRSLVVDRAHRLGGKEIASLLPNATQLFILKVTQSNLDVDGILALTSLRSLRILYIGGNCVDAEGAQALSKLQQLHTLHADCNYINDAAATSISTMVNLHTLNLSRNQISNAGALALSTMPELRNLDVCYNKIGTKGFAALARICLESLETDARSSRRSRITCHILPS